MSTGIDVERLAKAMRIAQRHAERRLHEGDADYIAREYATLMADVGRPEIVVLCGSTRFYDEFQQANYDLTMAGKIVLSVGFYPHAKAKAGHGEGVGHDSAEKVALDELHKRKIDLADRVLVLNVGGYIGESTRSEIDYAKVKGKLVQYSQAWSPEPASGAPEPLPRSVG